VKFGSRRTNQNAEKLTNQAHQFRRQHEWNKLVVNASSLLLATARARCVFVHVPVSVRLPSPRALRRNAYINQRVGRSELRTSLQECEDSGRCFGSVGMRSRSAPQSLYKPVSRLCTHFLCCLERWESIVLCSPVEVLCFRVLVVL